MKVYEYIVRIKDQATDKLRRLHNAIKGTRDPLSRYNKSLDQTTKNTSALGGVTSTLARWIGPAVLGAALVAGATKASALAREFEQTQISFEVMLGSAKKGQALLGQIIDMASVTPFTSRDLQQSGKLLLGYGVSATKLIPTLKMLGDISGGNADKLYHLSLAYAQTQAAGRLMGQDLLQMVNAGFNPLKIISEKTGLSIGKLKKKMEDGAISAKMVEAAFKMATERGGQFFNMMERQSATFEGRMSTLKDKMEIWGTGIGMTINTFLSPALDDAIKRLDLMIDKTNALRNENTKQRDAVRHLHTEIKPLLDEFDRLGEKGKSKSEKEFKRFEELKKIIAGAAPISVLRFDKSGNATGVSSPFARKFIEDQEKAFDVMNMEAQRAVQSKLKEISTERKQIEHAIKAYQNGELKGSRQSDAAYRVDQNKAISTGLAKINQLSEEAIKLESQLGQLRSDRTLAYLKENKEAASKIDPFADLTKGGKGDDGIDKITGGGKQHVNVTINLDNLVGVMNFDVKNVKESVRDMEKMVVESMLRVVNSANYAAQQ